MPSKGVKAKNGRRGKVIHEDRVYYYENQSGKSEHYKCSKPYCKGRAAKSLTTGAMVVTKEHVCTAAPFERAKDAAVERLRELTLAAEEGDKAIGIVRRLLQELPPETRAILPDEERLSQRVRRWARAGGVELVRSTFEDYLVEDGLEDVIPPPPSTQNPDSIKKEPIAGSSGEKEKKPDLIFLKGRAGEKLRVMIDDKIYIWNRDLVQGGSVYRCQESRIGCRVTVKILQEEKQYEIRGTHVHEIKSVLARKPFSKRPSQSLKLVDEEGRDLGNVDIDNILTAGEDVSNFALDYDNLPRVDSTLASMSAEPTVSTSPQQNQDSHIESRVDEVPTDGNDFFDDCGAGEPDIASDDDLPMEHEVETKSIKALTTARTVSTSSTVRQRSTEKRKDAQKSGEKCCACGDDLIVSEALSSSEETFRKACCYLNIKSENEWFPRKSNGQFYSFCESCTNEVSRIHQLYKKVEEIQSLIFKKVEHVEKRIAEAEIVDNWMAEVTSTSARRFEGFRKQALINYRNKLKLRREIRVGSKMGHRFNEIQPVSTANMFASDPADTNAFRRIVPTTNPVCTTENIPPPHSQSSHPPTLKRKRGRPKSKKLNQTPESDPICSTQEGDVFAEGDGGEFIGFDDPHDDAISVTSEREMKFWEEDPSRLHVHKDSDENVGVGNDIATGPGADNIADEYDDDGDHSPANLESDPDYEMDDDDDDEEWGKRKTRRTKGATGKRRGRPPSSVATPKFVSVKAKSWAERFAEAKAARAAISKNNPNVNRMKPQESGKATQESKSNSESEKPKSKAGRSGNYEFPDAMLTKDGRVFMSGIEIIKNPPGAFRRRPHSISFSCSICGKIIPCFWRMKQHICGNHLGMYKCDTCGKQFSDPKTLQRHNIWKHSEKAGTHTPCPICGRPIVGDSRNMRHHRWSHLGEEEKKDPQYRGYCPASKKDPNRLKANRGLQTFMCSFCPKTFHHTVALRKHEMVHTGEGPTYQCQFCGKMYGTRKGLYQHSSNCGKKAEGKTVDSLVTYPCPKCPVRFKTRGTRSKHMRRFHGNVTDSSLPFSCPKCPRSFATRGGFKTHKRICVEGQASAQGNQGSGRTRSKKNINQCQDNLPSTSSSGGNPTSAIGGGQPAFQDNPSNSSGATSSTNSNAQGSFGGGGFGYSMIGSYPGGTVYQPHQSHPHQSHHHQ